jgi:hypothetical protein
MPVKSSMKKLYTSSFTIPENKEGKPVDIEKRVKKKSVEEAGSFFQIVLARLLHPNNWFELSGKNGASFTIKKKIPSDLSDIIGEKDFLQVDIP